MNGGQPALSGFFQRHRDASRILVVDLGFLGDAVHTVPALWELRRNFPQASLEIVSSPLGCDVFKLAPCVERVWPLELNPEKRTLGQYLRVAAGLRRGRFNIAFNFGGADRSIFLTGLAGARQSIGYAAAGRWHAWNPLFIRHWVPPMSGAMRVYEQRRQVLAACGLDLGIPSFELKFPRDDAAWARSACPPRAVHFSINSGNPIKEWPLGHYAKLASLLLAAEPALNILITVGGGSREMARLAELKNLLSDKRVHFLAPALSIARLGSLLRLCLAHFGPDSGVVHLAQAIGTPSISLFRGQPGHEPWLPDQPGHRALVAKCPCGDNTGASCWAAQQAACLAEIQPERVMLELRTILQSRAAD